MLKHMSRIYAKLKKRDIISLPSDRGPTSLAGGGEEGGPAAVCVSDLLWTGRGGNWETGSSHGKSMGSPMGSPCRNIKQFMVWNWENCGKKLT